MGVVDESGECRQGEETTPASAHGDQREGDKDPERGGDGNPEREGDRDPEREGDGNLEREGDRDPEEGLEVLARTSSCSGQQ